MEDSYTELVNAAAKNDLKTFKSIIDEKGISPFRSKLCEIAQMAVKKGNLDIMEYIVERDPNTIEQRNELGELIVHIAAENGQLEAIRCIHREKPQSVSKKNFKGETIAHIAARKGHTNIIHFVIDEDPLMLKKKDSHGRTLLHWAVEQNVLDTETLKLLDKKGISMLSVAKNGDTITALASKVGNLDIIQYISRRKPSTLQRAMAFGETVGHIAAVYGHMNIIQYVAEKSPSSFEIKNDAGLTVAEVAAKYGHLDVIRCVAETVPSILKEYGKKIAEIACNNGHPDIIRYVMQNDESVPAEVDDDGHTMIHRAVRQNLTDAKTLKFFVEEGGVPLSTANKKNETIADFAIKSGNADIIRYVMEKEPSLLGTTKQQRRRRSVNRTDAPTAAVTELMAEYRASDGGVALSRLMNDSNHRLNGSSSRVASVRDHCHQLASILTMAALVFGGEARRSSSVRPSFSSLVVNTYYSGDDEIDEMAAVVEAVETFQYLEND